MSQQAEITEKYGNVNIEWILTGKGHPIKDNILEEPKFKYGESKDVEALQAIIESQKNTIELLKENNELYKMLYNQAKNEKRQAG